MNRNNNLRKKLPGYPITPRDKRMSQGNRLNRKQKRKGTI